MRVWKWVLILSAALPLLLEGCGADTAQVSAARVNGRAIPVAVAATDAGASGTALINFANSRSALEQRINQELLAQASQSLRLDADTEVLARIDAARTAILAQRYVDYAVQRSSAASEAEIDAYYRAHPELFAHRRIYLLRELTVSVPAPRFEEVRRRAGTAHELADVERWLDASHIAYRAENRARSSDEMPLEVLPAFLRLKTGDIGVARSVQGAWVLQLLASVPAPLSAAQARPLIADYLHERMRQAVTVAELQRLRDAAHIEYAEGFGPAPPARTRQASLAPPARSWLN